jgi:hypothetical protein
MRSGARTALALLVAFMAACSSGAGRGFFRQYEYEEEMYLSLDGSATMYVNSSIPALNALRGTTFDSRPNARVDTEAVRAYFTSPVTRVVRVSTSRRSNRRFVHVRVAVADIRRLNTAPPFAWSSYGLKHSGESVEYKQTVETDVGPTFRSGVTPERETTMVRRPDLSGPASAGVPRWTGQELVAFRIHIPSVITDHDNGADLRRGNILVWEQPLADRLKGVPLTLEARMEPQSILYTTLFLFGGTIAAAALTFAVLIWWIVRRGRERRTPNDEPRTEP